MKVIEINQNYKKGSNGQVVDLIANELRKNGHMCLVCCSDEISKNDLLNDYGL